MDRLAPLALDLPAVELMPRMPAGFRAGAVAAGIKASGGLDLGVLAVTGPPAGVAGTFTTNLIAAAPVRLSRAHLRATEGRTRAVLSTSGCANAATGPDGEQDQAALAGLLAGAIGAPVESTLAISTGLIGTRLPVEKLRQPLRRLVDKGLSPTEHGLGALAEQMCTTDTRSKVATVTLELPAADRTARRVTVSGIAKGVGMIHPHMATMLALILTDAAAEPKQLSSLLRPIVERTWNQLTVDGDTSTNDTVFLLASGAAGTAPVHPGSEGFASLARAVEAVARSLARQQAADGEGATTLITCQVSGAADEHEARAVARAVIASSLVKAAVHGHDPNWGRIAAAAGNGRVNGRPVRLDESLLAISIGGVSVFDGRPLPFDRAAVSALMSDMEVLLRLDLGLGRGYGEAFGCDLTEQYVIENSAYST